MEDLKNAVAKVTLDGIVHAASRARLTPCISLRTRRGRQVRVETLTRSELLEEVVACHRLGCGLEVCVYEAGVRQSALLATRYGSNDTRFRVNGERQ